jgi:hypothetical protein
MAFTGSAMQLGAAATAHCGAATRIRERLAFGPGEPLFFATWRAAATRAGAA